MSCSCQRDCNKDGSCGPPPVICKHPIKSKEGFDRYCGERVTYWPMLQDKCEEHRRDR